MSNNKHEIAVTPRSDFGKNASRRARREGLVPVNVYAKGKPNRAYYMKGNEWDVLGHEDFSYAYLVDGKEKIAVVVKEEQVNYMKSYTVHVDFQEISMKEDIHAAVKIVAIGSPAGESHGGVMEQFIHELTLVGKAEKLPSIIEVDVTALDLGGSIHVSDLAFPKGVTSDVPGETVVFHIVHADQDVDASAGEDAQPEVLTERKGE